MFVCTVSTTAASVEPPLPGMDSIGAALTHWLWFGRLAADMTCPPYMARTSTPLVMSATALLISGVENSSFWVFSCPGPNEKHPICSPWATSAATDVGGAGLSLKRKNASSVTSAPLPSFGRPVTSPEYA